MYHTKTKHLSTDGVTHEVMQACFGQAATSGLVSASADTSETLRESQQQGGLSRVAVLSDNEHSQVVLTQIQRKIVLLFDPLLVTS